MASPPLDIDTTLKGGFETFTRFAVPMILGLLTAALVSILTLGVCGPPMLIGYARLCLRAARGEVEVGSPLDGFDLFRPAWTLLFLMGLGVVVASVTIVGGIIVAYLFFWAPLIMADGNRNAIDCLRRSYEYNVKEVGPVIVFMIVTGLLMQVGHAVVLGGLVSIPIASAMLAHGYLRAFKDFDAGGDQADLAADAIAALDQLGR